MKKNILFIILLFSGSMLLAQNQADTTKTLQLKEVVVTANRQPVKLKNNPGALSLVTSKSLSLMPKSIGADEALRLVPGVRIDNQHDGERVHISIRGQGILTENGLRGIGVILDGIPVNDPSGFAPDLYDVDWATVKKIEVVRGPAAGLYGGGSAAGILNITTDNGDPKPVGGKISQSLGSNGFLKSLLQIGGTQNNINYRVSYSHTKGNGYREHQAFWGNNLYEKINFTPSSKLTITQIVAHTDYFQQNPEGLTLDQLNNPRQANPDANPFNEYQKTNRNTLGLHGTYRFDSHQDLQVVTYLHSWKFKETSNRAAEYDYITNPGASIQYNLHLSSGTVKHELSLGSDWQNQQIRTFKFESVANPNRVEGIDEANLETANVLADESVYQRSFGLFAFYKMTTGKFTLIANLRHDAITNKLTDKLSAPDTATSSKNFSQVSLRTGISYSFSDAFTLYANWSQGFMPPSTEELANNPTGYSGFNTHLIPATSNSYEIGARGFLGKKVDYEITGFIMYTKNDFFRFKQSGRGNQEVFYGNAGNSKRTGIETFLAWNIVKNLSWQTAYTFADYKYTSASIDPVYTDQSYVLTTPPAPGQYLPNSPKHQLYSELVYNYKKFAFSFATNYQSKWAIYTDAKAYNNELDPAIYQNWQKGFTLFNARAAYHFRLSKVRGELSLYVRNLTNRSYMAFTEPDPDGNAYQPGPGREFFWNLSFKF